MAEFSETDAMRVRLTTRSYDPTERNRKIACQSFAEHLDGGTVAATHDHCLCSECPVVRHGYRQDHTRCSAGPARCRKHEETALALARFGV